MKHMKQMFVITLVIMFVIVVIQVIKYFNIGINYVNYCGIDLKSAMRLTIGYKVGKFKDQKSWQLEWKKIKEEDEKKYPGFTLEPSPNMMFELLRIPCNVDITNDGKRNWKDFIEIIKKQGVCDNQNDFIINADIDGDGCVNDSDIRNFCKCY